MKTLFLPISLAAAMTAGAAAAQPMGWGVGRHASVDERQAMIVERIERGEMTGRLTRAEAWRLKQAFNAVARVEARYRWNGFSRWEVNDLHNRLDALQSDLRVALRDDDRRRYGYNEYAPPY
jgi:hypothetical protein